MKMPGYYKTLILFILTVNSFIGIFAQDVPSKRQAGSKEQQNKRTYSYKDNPQYDNQTNLYPFYKKKGKIVMLGNSITYRVNWSELLNRNDVINRGIGSDITEGFLNRLEYVYNVEPEICYIMGGVNDIGLKVPQEETVGNIKKLIDSLKHHGIIPVLQSVLYVAEYHKNYLISNQRIASLNEELKKVAAESKITFLDLNAHLSSDNKLIKEYALKDGVHLTGAGYEKWKTVLLADLKMHKIREKKFSCKK
jgi:lysophospholipase L1-like esterase